MEFFRVDWRLGEVWQVVPPGGVSRVIRYLPLWPISIRSLDFAQQPLQFELGRNCKGLPDSKSSFSP